MDQADIRFILDFDENDITNKNLTGVILRGANLSGVDFSNITLNESDLRGPYLSETIQNGSSLRTVQLVHSVIHRALVQAVKLGLISSNPDVRTSPPKPAKKEMQFFDKSQVQKFLIATFTYSDKFSALYHLAISTGMRKGEFMNQIDFPVQFRCK